MPEPRTVTDHYAHGDLLAAITAGLKKLGKTPDSATLADLGPVDEFHIGGRVATEDFLDQLGPSASDHLLDVGCGLGGASRFAADRYGCRVTGIDLTPDYVAAGNQLCQWAGLSDRVTLDQGDAAAMGFGDGSFDMAYMLHVGMNIADKTALFADLFRVLKPGGTLGVYDVMRMGDAPLAFPVPWATEEAGSAVAPPSAYKAAMADAGFQVAAERNRRDFALDFFARLKANAAGGPPPLGLHILMGPSAPAKVANMIANIAENRVAPVELIAKKPG